MRKKTEKDFENIINYNYNQNTFLYLNFFNQNYFSIIDFLPKDNSFIVWSEFTSDSLLLKRFEEEVNKEFIEKTKQGAILRDIGKLYISLDETLKKCRNYKQIRFSSLNDMPNINIEFNYTNIPVFSDKFNGLIEYIKNNKEKKIFIVTQQPQRALTILNEKDCNSSYIEDINFDIEKNKGIFVTKGSLLKGFVYNDIDLIFISDSELFGWTERQLKRKKETKNLGQKINKVDDIKIGDYVVHYIHGIGQYQGLRLVELNNQKREYFEILYSKGDKLLVPIEQINLISLYRGSGDAPPKLSKMGGIDWANQKNKVKESVKQLAFDLINLYAKRKNSIGYSFPPDTEWQKQMEDTFPYDETPDQLKAIIEVKTDMESNKIMDRLICGDVGFGKTEVAIRAIFKAIMSGKQVAVISPTTILSQQLFDVMNQRFSPYPIKMALLNRFRTTSETKKIYQDLKKGNIDLIVSTHKILMKTPEFFDLGLLVIDEEHKFGVAHKEKIKLLKENVDVLTMSATPIPRTLYMSLSGIRDISLIETPPSNRFPVKTKLSYFDLDIIKNAILYEIERGGQVYFVHNRVETLGIRFEQLKEILPSIRIGIAHGQLPEHELENVMLDFNNKNIDVLLCTTIIESGLDIPSANTIIIDNAHLLGLAQLYQLKGRVGRSDIQAYAYFMYPKETPLTEEAKERLSVIQDLNDLGSGYQVALKDMEIRGIGDLLGPQQHGNMLSVGYDTYCEILEEAINELKPNEEKTSNFSNINTIIDINIPCYIPDNYVTDFKLKMQYYRRLAVVQDIDLLNQIKEELEEYYGKLPLVLENLIKIVEIKIYAGKLNIKEIKVNNKLIKVKLSIDNKKWNEIQSKNQELFRWQWNKDYLETISTSFPENDLIIIDKFLKNIMALG
ncbi:MAG: transcription-repair-coupling factor [Candidatus Sericytochromatia bacterium]|nr:MAG: transcription-repair-coupling factor [Candidatus Sericytochromatia bacterium]